MRTLLFSLLFAMLAPFALKAQSAIAIHYLVDDGNIFVTVAGPDGEIESLSEKFTKPVRRGSGLSSSIEPEDQLQADVANTAILLKVIARYTDQGYEVADAHFGRGLDSNSVLESRSRSILMQKDD